jgi:protein TonB
MIHNTRSGDGTDNQVPSVSIRVELVSVEPEPKKNQNILVEQPEQPEVLQTAQALQTVAEQPEHQDEKKTQPADSVKAEIDADYSDLQAEREFHDAGKRADELRRFVYQAINREKRYPYLARRQRREGLVKLNFTMHPDGQVTDIAIVQSSRFSILDNAARQAVQAISPFQLAAEYLDAQHSYNVDIDFRLN